MQQSYQDLSNFSNNTQFIVEICQPNAFNMTQLRERIDSWQFSKDYSRATYSDHYDVEYTIEFLDDLVAFVLIPLASFIGFLLNFQVIRTIRKHQKKELRT
jgi:hypothetical protein